MELNDKVLTEKQKKAVEEYTKNGGSRGAAMIKAGYSPASAKNPKFLFDTPKVQNAVAQALDKAGISLDRVMKTVSDGLNASKVISAKITSKPRSGDVAALQDANENTDDFIEVPDNAARLKAADMSLKLLAAYDRPKPINNPPEPQDPTELAAALKDADEITLSQIMFNKTTDQRTIIKPDKDAS